MMRRVAGSLFRFGWAMGMLGIDQAANVLDRERGWRRSSDSLDAVTEVARSHLGPTARRFFEAGDHFQDGVADTVSHVAQGVTGDGDFGDARRRFDAMVETIREDLRGGDSGGEETEPA